MLRAMAEGADGFQGSNSWVAACVCIVHEHPTAPAEQWADGDRARWIESLLADHARFPAVTVYRTALGLIVPPHATVRVAVADGAAATELLSVLYQLLELGCLDRFLAVLLVVERLWPCRQPQIVEGLHLAVPDV
jgi:hypothetical protein